MALKIKIKIDEDYKKSLEYAGFKYGDVVLLNHTTHIYKIVDIIFPPNLPQSTQKERDNIPSGQVEFVLARMGTMYKLLKRPSKKTIFSRSIYIKKLAKSDFDYRDPTKSYSYRKSQYRLTTLQTRKQNMDNVQQILGL